MTPRCLVLQRLLLGRRGCRGSLCPAVGVHRDGDRLARRIGLRIESVSGHGDTARKEGAMCAALEVAGRLLQMTRRRGPTTLCVAVTERWADEQRPGSTRAACAKARLADVSRNRAAG